LEAEKRPREELLVKAAEARVEAARYHRAAVMINAPATEEALLARESELLKLAQSLEAQAAALSRE
jgi:hypothetical protein